jgi:hypothetical protein
MPRTVHEDLSIPQPGADPIRISEFDVEDYTVVKDLVLSAAGKDAPEHLIAGAFNDSASPSYDLTLEDRAVIARSWVDAQNVITDEPGAPFISTLHCRKAVGIAEQDSQLRYVDTAAGISEHFQLLVETTSSAKTDLHGGGYEGKTTYAGKGSVKLYRPLSVLSSGSPDDVSSFLNDRPEWMRYPNTQVVIGSKAVNAFLRAQAQIELGDRVHETRVAHYGCSDAMLSLASLKQLGHSINMGQSADVIHQTGIDIVARILVSGFSFDRNLISTFGQSEEGIAPRLAAVDFIVEDASSIGLRAAQLHNTHVTSGFGALTDRNNGDLRKFFTGSAQSFLEHILGVKP